jgi:hypothetical protein
MHLSMLSRRGGRGGEYVLDFLTFSRHFLSILPRGWKSELNIRTQGAKLMSKVLVPGSRRVNQPYLGNEKIVESPGFGTACTVKLPP